MLANACMSSGSRWSRRAWCSGAAILVFSAILLGLLVRLDADAVDQVREVLLPQGADIVGHPDLVSRGLGGLVSLECLVDDGILDFCEGVGEVMVGSVGHFAFLGGRLGVASGI